MCGEADWEGTWSHWSYFPRGSSQVLLWCVSLWFFQRLLQRELSCYGKWVKPSQDIHAKVPEWNVVLVFDGMLRWEAGLRGKSISAVKHLVFHGQKPHQNKTIKIVISLRAKTFLFLNLSLPAHQKAWDGVPNLTPKRGNNETFSNTWYIPFSLAHQSIQGLPLKNLLQLPLFTG